jgi:hypothetical protein
MFSFQIFVAYFNFFISLWWYDQIYSNLNSNFKIDFFNFFHFQMFSFQIFVAYFNFFISLWWYDQFYSNFNSNFKIDFFQFPSGGMAKLFQNSKIKIFNSNFKNEKFSFFSFQKFLEALAIFSRPMLPNLLKDCKNYLFTISKNSHIQHTT